MIFDSILFPRTGIDPGVQSGEAPAFFKDLNLDQTVEAVTANWKEYDLNPFFYSPLEDLDAIAYRQEVVRDLEGKILFDEISAFSAQMRKVRDRLQQAKKLEDYKYARERCFLAAAELYCAGVERLAQLLTTLELKSRGLCSFRVFLNAYIRSNAFRHFATQTHKLRALLSAVRYSLLIRDGGITVRQCDSKNDYSSTIEEMFKKFRQGASQEYWVELHKWSGMNHIEAQVQQRVALLYPDTFRALDAFCEEQATFLDPTVARFDREIQFYVAYLTHIEKFRRAGLSFCLPDLSRTSKEIRGRDAFDLALAEKLCRERSSTVPNDFHLAASERILVVSGPNHGGKTTFARMLGQMHYLASLGLPVSGREAQLFLPDQLFTHFEREEGITNLRGKLQDDLVRIYEILCNATPNSIVVMNEVFSSTTLKDAIDLSKKVMTKLSELDLLVVWVTFLDELSSFNDKTVSMVAMVDARNPAVRTYKLERHPANGLAHAFAIAQKHRVTYECLKERLRS
jgi:DNA mismatch repair protein MutS